MSTFEFNPNDLHRLKRFRMLGKKLQTDQLAGSRASKHAGHGTDFLDYRAYAAGDDVRRVDWNVYGRLRQVFIRLYEQPEQSAVHILIDCSASMAFGNPVSKLVQAQRIACGVAFVALRGNSRVTLTTVAGGDAVGERGLPGSVSGVRGIGKIVKFVAQLAAAGRSDLREAAMRMKSMRRSRGLVVVISDMLGSENYEAAIDFWAATGARVLLFQVLDEIDFGSGLEGRVRVRDSENRREVDVVASDVIRRALRKRVEAWCDSIGKRVVARGGSTVVVRTDADYVERVGLAVQFGAIGGGRP